MFADALMFWVGMASVLLVAMTAVLLSAVLWLRQYRLRFQEAREQVRRIWQPLLFARAIETDSGAALPTLRDRDLVHFIELWMTLYQTLRGPARERLVALARDLNLNARLRYWLLATDIDRRLTAIVMLGYLQDTPSQERIRPYLDDPRTVASLCAARALIALDAYQGLQDILPHLTRPDWSPGRIAGLLEDIEPEARMTMLSDTLQQADAGQAVRILRVLRILAPGTHDAAIAAALARFGADEEILSAALASMVNPRWIETARAQCQHPVWHVRVQAVQALGRMGSSADLPLLLRCLTDSMWWVRMRSAQALLQLRGLSRADLEQAVTALEDRYAREALDEALRHKVTST